MFKALINVAARRFAGAIPTVLLLSIVVFFVLRALPADPLAMLLPPNATQADADAVRHALGLDRSIVVQYVIWLRDALHGNLGTSISFREPVTRLLANSLPATLELSFAGLALALIISIPGGLLLYGTRGTVIENILDVLVVCMLSIPAFLWAIFLMLGFGVMLGWLPFSGRVDSGIVMPAGGTGFLLIDYIITFQFGHWHNAFLHLILPASALALGFSPLVIRVLRSSLLEASDDHYVTVARQRGLTEQQIILKHMLRNSALPTITLIGAQFGFLFGGTLLVETIFSYPGIGNLMVQAVRNHDLPLIQGIALVFCVITLLINTVVDILYVVLNPKLRRA
ncbi:ABC transporter permease [Pseudorhodoplanes sinuspersici]|uniref:ABC transporter permease n=1 Tax=Pseudorhodoplanes sinuspersici TaxID=1235591 RepID=A0A1W6ZZ59_9HYPH|nr:ABC transporter permease [Pseudorhodoplanes sinuspersici]ARQ02411.1 ABC transporter permease [Pseudorhodoplanes sinuspersici]RKE74246.1 peptide/nickel transport system permease protein [Pseudorhodoplanes sinuspersici]